jgi:hypothetical protein
MVGWNSQCMGLQKPAESLMGEINLQSKVDTPRRKNPKILYKKK